MGSNQSYLKLLDNLQLHMSADAQGARVRRRNTTISTYVGGQLISVQGPLESHVTVRDVVVSGNLTVRSTGGVTVENAVVAGDIHVTNTLPAPIAKQVEDLDVLAVTLVGDAGQRAREVVQRARAASRWSRPNAAYITILLFIAGLLIVPTALKVTLFLGAAVTAFVWWVGARRHRLNTASDVLAELDKIDLEATGALAALEES